MSHDIGNAQGLGFGLSVNDRRHCDEDLFGNDDLFQPDPICNYYVREDLWFGTQTFRSPWWPSAGAGFLLGDAGDVNCLYDKLRRYTDPWPNTPGSCNGRLSFVGYTRDQYGSAVGFCTVRCFNTATNALVATVISDGNGYYIATTPYSDAHYLVVHKSGSPEIAGASVSTLTPA